MVRRLVQLAAAHVAATALLLGAWAFAGAGALSGRMDFGWLAAGALCLATSIPLRWWSRLIEGEVALGAVALLKRRLLEGAMAMDGDSVSIRGSGELLSDILEVEAIQDLWAGGGMQSLLAVLELLLIAMMFAWADGGLLQILVLACWCGLTAILFARNLELQRRWTDRRLGLTHRLVENMAAHRTRLAQLDAREWHTAEDMELRGYLAASEKLDRSAARMEALPARGYVVVAVAALMAGWIAGARSPADLTISLGAILYAASALERMALGVPKLTAAWIVWKRIKPVVDACNPAQPATARGDAEDISLEVRDLVFRYGDRPEPVLRSASISVGPGDLVLLEGESGSGKSTLGSLLAGLRKPTAGTILAGGLDRQTLGIDGWRRRVASAPQYGRNHIFSAPLGFNLLLGRAYPHTVEDLEEAREVCIELGLGPLLERMPAGLDQMVGETGWRLSEGERGRVFLARALLQRADVVVLDECMAALDPENLQQCLECVIRRSKSLIVIAHP